MESRTFSVVSSLAMSLSLIVAALSIIAVPITGFYPGIIVLFLLALIPIASKFYAKKISNKSADVQKKQITALTIINLLTILTLIWMAFVILIDRVFSNIL